MNLTSRSFFIFFYAIPLAILLFAACGPARKTTSSRPHVGAEPATPIGAYKMHTVSAGETMESIAIKYGVTTTRLRSANPSVGRIVPAGVVMRVPAESTTPPDTVKPHIVKPPPVVVREPHTFRIAVLLPFRATQQDLSLPDAKPEPTSVIAVEFYQGLRLALDTLEKQGLRAQIDIIDTDRDSTAISDFLHRPSSKDLDIVIGPAYSAKVEQVAAFCKQNNIRIISPLSSSPDLCANNPNALQFVPTANTQIMAATKLLVQKFTGARFVLLHTDMSLEKELATMFSNALAATGETDIISVNSESDGGLRLLREKLHPTRVNVIVVTSSREAYVTSTLALISGLVNTFNIHVMGLPTWDNFETLDPGKLHKCDVHLFLTLTINSGKYLTNTVRQQFMSRFKTDPSVYAYTGYDVMSLLGKAMIQYDTQYWDKLNEVHVDATQNGVLLTKPTEGGGWENQAVLLMRYHDFQLVNAFK